MSKRSAAIAEKDGRERILAVAIRSFSEVGYEGTTTAGVARDAEVTVIVVKKRSGPLHSFLRQTVLEPSTNDSNGGERQPE